MTRCNLKMHRSVHQFGVFHQPSLRVIFRSFVHATLLFDFFFAFCQCLCDSKLPWNSVFMCFASSFCSFHRNLVLCVHTLFCVPRFFRLFRCVENSTNSNLVCKVFFFFLCVMPSSSHERWSMNIAEECKRRRYIGRVSCVWTFTLNWCVISENFTGVPKWPNSNYNLHDTQSLAELCLCSHQFQFNLLANSINFNFYLNDIAHGIPHAVSVYVRR